MLFVCFVFSYYSDDVSSYLALDTSIRTRACSPYAAIKVALFLLLFLLIILFCFCIYRKVDFLHTIMFDYIIIHHQMLIIVL